jgi:hypothetical protein
MVNPSRCFRNRGNDEIKGYLSFELKSHKKNRTTIPYHTIPYHTIPDHTIPYQTTPDQTNKTKSGWNNQGIVVGYGALCNLE